MRRSTVIAESDVPGGRSEGDTVLEKTIFDASNGSEVLVQRVLRFDRGTSQPRGDDELDELLYVATGTGTLVLDGREHPLEPETAAYVRAGERYTVVVDDPEGLFAIAVSAPSVHHDDADAAPRRVTVRFADRPEDRADERRTFRILLDESTGSPNATQFVGLVEPCRAPDHSHSYDEVGFILEGQGFAHLNGAATPLRPGSCFHLRPGVVHCIENTGPGVMRILGVFHPSGDPASRTYDEAALTAEGGNK
jgi:mannose-6-phosphate isomerase-like protein (cupin superfamily)